MKIVIDIDDKIFNDAKNGYVRLGEIADAVLSGTPYEERPTADIDLTYKDLDIAKRGNFREVFKLPS